MFKTGFKALACEGDSITCEMDGFTCTARIYRNDCGDAPDNRNEGFWPSKDKDAAGYVKPEDFATEQAKAENAMRAWQADEWFYCGIAVTASRAGVDLTGKYAAALWGIECNYPDSDNAYLLEVANELLTEALENAKTKLKALCAN